MSLDFIFVPDRQIFETACLARENNQNNHPCLEIFISAWHHYVDSREKIIHISKNIDEYLIKNNYKSDKKKRQALFTILCVRDPFDCSIDVSQIKLASILSIEEDKTIYYITDNKEVLELLKSSPFNVIDSSKAIELLKKSI